MVASVVKNLNNRYIKMRKSNFRKSRHYANKSPKGNSSQTKNQFEQIKSFKAQIDKLYAEISGPPREAKWNNTGKEVGSLPGESEHSDEVSDKEELESPSISSLPGRDDDGKTLSRGTIKIPIFKDSPYNDKGDKDFTKLYNKAKDWLFKVEIAFQANKTPEHLKVAKAVQGLKGAALTWFKTKWEHEPNILKISWEKFVENFKNAFFPSTNVYSYVDDYDYLNWRQDENVTVASYIVGFKARQQAREGVASEKRLVISKFMWGLREPIRKYVEQSKPDTIETAYKLALEGEKAVSERGNSNIMDEKVLFEFMSNFKKKYWNGNYKKNRRWYKNNRYQKGAKLDNKPAYNVDNINKENSTYFFHQYGL